MTKIFREADADPTLLPNRPIAMIGFGNQGEAQARNLRDSGADILIGNIADDYFTKAQVAGFPVYPIAEAVKQAEIIILLIPDEVLPAVFASEVVPHLRPGATLVFASGYNVGFQQIRCPKHTDVVLLAPRMVGRGVRELYEKRTGFYSFVAVERDATGQAWPTLLALAWGIGTLRKGAVEVTFRMEAELDLFNEQAFGPAFGRVLLTSIQTLIKAGYPREAVLLEMYLSGELGYIFQQMAEVGLIAQLDHHSQTSQYGAISRGVQFLGINLAAPMRRILRNIQSGGFAREWSFEQWLGRWRYRLLKALALRQPINRLEQEVQQQLQIPNGHATNASAVPIVPPDPKTLSPTVERTAHESKRASDSIEPLTT